MKKDLTGSLGEIIRLRKSKIRAMIYIILVAILSMLIYQTYNSYKKEIIVQQQQNMLNTSKSISRSIELFTREVVDSIRILTYDRDFRGNISNLKQGRMNQSYTEKLRSYYEAEGKAVNAVYLFDENGKLLGQYPDNNSGVSGNLQDDIGRVLTGKKTYIGKVYPDEAPNKLVFNINEPIFDGGSLKGVVTVSIGLDEIFDRLIAPVKIGEKGYAMVKDQTGLIIMHTVKEQVGINVIESRKKMHPDLDFEDLEELVRNQLTGEEGTAIYHSYWWGDDKLEKAKKLNAYAPIHFGEHFWVVALTMSYDEIQEPINAFLIKIIGIAGLIVSIISIFIFALIRMKKSKEELEREKEYLKILKDTSEELRKKESELYHSKKLKMIGTLAGGIAHDINNLLTPILGYSELLLARMPEGSEYYDEVDEIFKASQRGKDMIGQILSFSRNETGQVSVEPVKINDVLDETIKLVKSVIPKNVTLKEHIMKDCGLINANYTQIHQVIFNLCTNAYQAIKGDKGNVEVSLTTFSGGDVNLGSTSLPAYRDYVQIRVKDTGCGMDEETKERLFEPFFTTKVKGEGTGLGLFVVESIIKNHEGAITVESEKGKGSCFNIYLPLIGGPSEEENTDEFEGPYGSIKVLVVDDNEENLKVLKKGLEHIGAEVSLEKDSKKVLKRIKTKQWKFDIIITDYMMPEVKGNELADAVKEANPATGVILMSGYLDRDGEAIKNSKSIDFFLSKPIELSKLSEAVKKALRSR